MKTGPALKSPRREGARVTGLKARAPSWVEQQIEESTMQLERISAAVACCTRIRQIPGIGAIIETAIVAAISNGAGLRKEDQTSRMSWRRATAVCCRWVCYGRGWSEAPDLLLAGLQTAK
jgi:hypothetical protein